MALVIIPLAGPELYTEKFGIRPLFSVGSITLIEYVLATRPWMVRSDQSNQVVFVLRDDNSHLQILQSFIHKKFPFAKTVVLEGLTLGSSMSVLAGISMMQDFRGPIIVDLADIVFDMAIDPIEYFRFNDDVDGLIPFFYSTENKFSYIKLDGKCVTKALEKQVISTNASVGVYFFRDACSYLRSMVFSLEHPDVCRVGSSFFVCPAMNGLIMDGRKVHAIEVQNVDPLSTYFHED